MNCLINYDLIASDYSRHRKVHPEVYKNLLAYVGQNASCRILEVGCGTGNYIRSISNATACQCIGIDPSPGMLSIAREDLPAVTLIQARGEFLPFFCRSFDLVFSVDVIHHLSERKQYFAEAYRILQPGGWFCTVTDSEWIIRHRKPLAAYFPETVSIELKRYPAIADVETILTAEGFTEISTYMVEFTYQLTDLQPYRDKVYSALHHISNAAFQQGIQNLERDLALGPVPCISYYSLVWGKKPSNSSGLNS